MVTLRRPGGRPSRRPGRRVWDSSRRSDRFVRTRGAWADLGTRATRTNPTTAHLEEPDRLKAAVVYMPLGRGPRAPGRVTSSGAWPVLPT